MNGRPLGVAALAALASSFSPWREAIEYAVRVEREDQYERALGVDIESGPVVLLTDGHSVWAPDGRRGVIIPNGSRCYVWIEGDPHPHRLAP